MAVCTQLLAAQFYQHCATLYTNLYCGTTLSYPFSKNLIFKKIFGPFPEAPGAFAPHFRIPYSRYISTNFFPSFDLNSHFLLHGTAKRLNSTLIRPSCTTPRGAQPVGPRHTWPTSPLEAVEPNLHRHPTPLLYSFFSFSPKSMVGYTEGYTTGSLFLRSTREISTRLHGITSQNRAPFLLTAVRSSNLAYLWSLHGGANCCNEDN